VKSLQLEGFGGQSGRGVSAELVSALKDGGLELNVWTVDEPKEARRMRDIGVNSVTTNDPKLILEAL
jgi:glycerophosphoryl diester phosphodiesterase